MKIKNFLLLVFSTIALSGCVANVDRTRMSDLNNYSEKVIRDSIVVGKSTKKDVLLLLGAPATPKEFKTANTWIYASKVVDRRLYFFIPVFRDRDQLLLLKFNDAGVVSKMDYTEK
ncbi:outer membrane protein assembly factor BamE domain-containing protein [[Erwinia] mediterraneensis]|uniref:outer membrane protein assembly factor BamE domain-containing protein n=1 Tax=[Erwinia] mediterraneensis TaxID=2161819 RepID=UPI001030C7BA|nr:outer membrane protein assembly factor BamE [[Erwinia] mediterraneensis]